jgi:hypothetical protein
MYALMMSRGGPTDEQKEQIRAEWSSRFDGPLPEKLDSLITTEKRSAAESKKYIEQKLRNGEPISEQDLVGLDFNTWQQYKGKLDAQKTNILDSDEAKTNIKALAEQLRFNLGAQEIGAPTDPTLGLAANRAKQQYISLVTGLTSSGMDPSAAHEQARKTVMDDIQRGKTSAKGPGQPYTAGVGLYKLESFGGRMGYVEFLNGGKSSQAMMATERQLNGIKASLAGGGKAVLWSRKLVNDQDLALIERLREDPSGPIPASVEYLARMTGLSTWDVMDQQMKFLKQPPLTKPPSVLYADQDPEFQRLLKSRPSARRVARAFAGKPWSPEKVPNGWGRQIEKAAAANGLDPAMLAGLIRQESNWNPRAVSRTGYKGLGQFGKAAMIDTGLKDPFDPIASIDAAAKYLGMQMKAFKGDPVLALRAYNQGAGDTQRFPGGASQEAKEYPGLVLGHARTYGYGQTGAGYASPDLINPRISRAVSRTFDGGQPGLDLYFENKQFPAVLPGRVKEVGYQGRGRGASGQG